MADQNPWATICRRLLACPLFGICIMLTSSLYRFLLTPAAKTPRSRMMFWLALSLTFSVIYYIPAFQQVLSSPYVVQDDARQHVSWMMRFSDPALFPGNLIADYFQSVAPLGYTTLYRIFAWFGVNAMLLHKLLPLPLLLMTTAYGFFLCLQVLAVPVAGFLFTLMLNQSLWMRDDVISATPTAFLYPIFLAFLYYLIRGRLIPCLVTIALQGLFYPQCMFIFCMILLLRLLRWENRRLRFSRDRQDYWFCISGLGVAFLVILPYLFRSSEFGPVVTAAQAKLMPTFGDNKWSEFYPRWAYPFSFVKKFLLCGRRAGMLPLEWCGIDYGGPDALGTDKTKLLRVTFGLPQLIFGILFPILLCFPRRFPLVQQVSPNIRALWQTLAASLIMFGCSHALLFKLHLPSRYTEHTLRFLAPFAAAMAITILLDAVFRYYLDAKQSQRATRSMVAVGAVILSAVVLLAYPQFLRLRQNPYPIVNYIIGQSPELYKFFAEQPKNIVIASIAPETNNLPSYTGRSILVGGEGYTLPYHLGYYRETVRRTKQLVNAQYSPSLDDVKAFIRKYSVDFWMVERRAFKSNYLTTNPTLIEFDELRASTETLLKSGTPALTQIPRRCYAYDDAQYRVIDTKCVLQRTGG